MDKQKNRKNRVLAALAAACVALCLLASGCSFINGLITPAPLADAGLDQPDARVSDEISLDGTASRDASSYLWSFDQKPADSLLEDADIANRTRIIASFTPDVAGKYILMLTV